MNIELQLQGQDATDKTVLALRDWIQQEKIEGLRIDHKSVPPQEGEMGTGIEILAIVLGSAAVVELVKSIQVWIKSRRPIVKIKFKKGNAEIEIDAENLPDQQTIIDKIVALIENREG